MMSGPNSNDIDNGNSNNDYVTDHHDDNDNAEGVFGSANARVDDESSSYGKAKVEVAK